MTRYIRLVVDVVVGGHIIQPAFAASKLSGLCLFVRSFLLVDMFEQCQQPAASRQSVEELRKNLTSQPSRGRAVTFMLAKCWEILFDSGTSFVEVFPKLRVELC